MIGTSNPWKLDMSSNSLVPCQDCGHLVSQQAETCPSCARPLRTPAPREGLFLRMMNQVVAAGFWIVALLVLVPLAAALIGVLTAR